MTKRPFTQVDVFTADACRGNPVAVVLDAEGLPDHELAAFARWTNLSETTFVLAPTDPAADYRVRIFTPSEELPFAGHPTLGTCHAWLEAGQTPRRADRIVQECGLGLVQLRRQGHRLAFAAPPLRRSGPVDATSLSKACAVLGIGRAAVVDAAWCDNGPGWLAVMVASADEVLAIRPDFAAAAGEGIGLVGSHPIGVVGHRDSGDPAVIEVRAFFRSGTALAEDPVTGSLNAALAQWLLGNGVLEAPYVASQGSAIGRVGKVHVDVAEGQIWVGGDTCTVIAGVAHL